MPDEFEIELPKDTKIPKRRTVQVSVTEIQYEHLRGLAERRCTTVAEIVRAACVQGGLFRGLPRTQHGGGTTG